MIVVATHNGKDHLPTLLDSLERFGTGGHDVLVLETGSNCQESLRKLEELAGRTWSFSLRTGRTPYSGYDSGAYIYAFYNNPAESYLFLQDSVTVKDHDWIQAFESLATFGVGCVPWLTFPMQWNSQEQVDWVMDKLSTADWPPMGVFGPIFYAKREALEDLDRRGFLNAIPSCKSEQMAMERFWSTAFIVAGWAVRPLEYPFDEKRLNADLYRHLTKRFAIRA